MLRWIVILLIAALPLRSGMAAAQLCPWMAAGLLSQVASATLPSAAMQAMDSMTTMGEDCLGMSTTDGHCTLQAGCAAPPLLPSHPKMASVQTVPMHTPWHAVHSLFTYSSVPQRIPISLA
jgi:hypothetical protein